MSQTCNAEIGRSTWLSHELSVEGCGKENSPRPIIGTRASQLRKPSGISPHTTLNEAARAGDREGQEGLSSWDDLYMVPVERGARS